MNMWCKLWCKYKLKGICCNCFYFSHAKFNSWRKCDVHEISIFLFSFIFQHFILWKFPSYTFFIVILLPNENDVFLSLSLSVCFLILFVGRSFAREKSTEKSTAIGLIWFSSFLAFLRLLWNGRGRETMIAINMHHCVIVQSLTAARFGLFIWSILVTIN